MKPLESDPGAKTSTPRSGPGQGERLIPAVKKSRWERLSLWGIIGCHARAVRGVDPEARGEEGSYFKPK